MDIDLTEFGLTVKEQNVYLFLLKGGPSAISEICSKSDFHRPVLYGILERLMHKGFVSFSVSEGRKYYEASSPKIFESLFEEKRTKLSSFMPALLAMSGSTSNLDVKIFKGKNGLKAVFEDILAKRPCEWLSLGSTGETNAHLNSYLGHFHRKRVRHNIPVRGLLIDSEKSKNRMDELHEFNLTRLRLLPASFRTPTVINIYDDNVALYSVLDSGPSFTLLVNNDLFANSFKEHFNWLWNQNS